MKAHAEGRIKDLKSRGYKNAGLYDPPGVSGTHVMYVLHHARQAGNIPRPPQQSEDQPDRRVVEGRVEICRLAAIGIFAAIGFFHHIVEGPNKVSSEDEENAKRLAGVAGHDSL